VEILNASGRIVRRIPGSKQADGWHSIQLAGVENRSDNAAAGVYFARFSIDGNYQSVKRIFVIR
jgi:flagellar hook assembly protein FlgD